jgi:uncharacterized SAM-binding protein YcdF (DUF218 family)
MFFLLSKTLGVLIVPSNFMMALGALGLVLTWSRFKRSGQRLLAVCVAALLCCGYFPVGALFLVPLETRFPALTADATEPTGMVVLGGGIDPELSEIHGLPALSAGAARIVVAAELARQYPHARILYAGGDGNLVQKDQTEADAAAEVLEKLGVTHDRLEIERQSRNTEENARFAMNLAKPKPGERWLLITSASHMPRAIGIFRKIGFLVEPCPVDFKTRGWIDVFKLQTDFIGGLNLTNTAIHEWIGLVAYRLAGKTDALLPAPLPSPSPAHVPAAVEATAPVQAVLSAGKP